MIDEERRAAFADIIENVDQYGLGDGSRALDVALDAITDLFAPQAARIAELEALLRKIEALGPFDMIRAVLKG